MGSGRNYANNLNLIGEILTQCKTGAADSAKHVPPIGDFFHPHLLAEANLTELTASGAFYLLDLELTTDRRLTQGQGGITFKFEGERGHIVREKEALLRLVRNNKRHKSRSSF